ncbi:uncharacterized protein QC763_707460 [Podospora pseudopauciseta]|uniref:Uncharacterized protein n=2 Tax=Podospora TaxID=5144 RepID=A0ABR0H1K1_9PEZI|nr:hypothetical protein QC763_707460 [Podospora pseudopauciseta]KAK4668454.1 hypothetical protein QC764_707460 [Podospora pseudoanserina]
MTSSSSSSGQGSRPGPLDIGGSSSSRTTDYFNCNGEATSPTSPASTTAPLFPRSRTAYGSSPPDSVKGAKSPRKVNANSYCGRHSDEFLFGGRSLGDLWRAVKK